MVDILCRRLDIITYIFFDIYLPQLNEFCQLHLHRVSNSNDAAGEKRKQIKFSSVSWSLGACYCPLLQWQIYEVENVSTFTPKCLCTVYTSVTNIENANDADEKNWIWMKISGASW